jgi:hypothetical protein
MMIIWNRATSLLRRWAPLLKEKQSPSNGEKSDFAGIQAGRIIADCMVNLKSDTERSQFLIANTNWFKPA